MHCKGATAPLIFRAETKRMSTWINHCFRRIKILCAGYDGTALLCILNCRIQIVHMKIQVHHLRLFPCFPWPDRRYIVIYRLEKDRMNSVGRADCSPFVCVMNLFPVQQFLIKISQTACIIGIKAYGTHGNEAFPHISTTFLIGSLKVWP